MTVLSSKARAYAVREAYVHVRTLTVHPVNIVAAAAWAAAHYYRSKRHQLAMMQLIIAEVRAEEERYREELDARGREHAAYEAFLAEHFADIVADAVCRKR